MSSFTNISAAELQAIEGGRIKLREEAPLPVQEPSGGAGYTGIMITYTLTVSSQQVPC